MEGVLELLQVLQPVTTNMRQRSSGGNQRRGKHG